MTAREENIISVSIHTSGKTDIASDVDGHPYWRPLLPIVKFCLDRDCKFTNEHATLGNPFYEDRNGSFSCMLAGPVTVQDILESFNVPEHFEIGVPYANSISDMKHRCDITLMSTEDLEKMRKRSEDAKNRRSLLKDSIRSDCYA